MFGLVKWREAGESGGIYLRSLDGVRFLTVYVRRGEGFCADWSTRRAARLLQKHGVTEAVFPQGFSNGGRFAARGVRPVDVRPLREAAAVSLIRCALAQQGIPPNRATVALCAARVTRACASAAERLAGDTRYLQLCAGEGSWELSLVLRTRFGIAAPVLHTPERADVALCFDNPTGLSAACVLPLRSPALHIQYAGTEEARGEEPEQLLAARYASLALRAEEIECVSYSANMGVER